MYASQQATGVIYKSNPNMIVENIDNEPFLIGSLILLSDKNQICE